MVSVNYVRCTYCGSCVSVCPVGALELAETRLIVDQSCMDCGLCLSACPTGALQAEPLRKTGTRGAGLPLRQQYDVIVIGAGPGGSVAAWEAARRGLSVLLLEKRQEIGSPVRCAEGVRPALDIGYGNGRRVHRDRR